MRVTTVVELYKDGSKMVFHRINKGGSSWTHRPGEPCEECDKNKGRTYRGVSPEEGIRIQLSTEGFLAELEELEEEEK